MLAMLAPILRNTESEARSSGLSLITDAIDP